MRSKFPVFCVLHWAHSAWHHIKTTLPKLVVNNAVWPELNQLKRSAFSIILPGPWTRQYAPINLLKLHRQRTWNATYSAALKLSYPCYKAHITNCTFQKALDLKALDLEALTLLLEFFFQCGELQFKLAIFEIYKDFIIRWNVFAREHQQPFVLSKQSWPQPPTSPMSPTWNRL